jgi:hypothetical protein
MIFIKTYMYIIVSDNKGAHHIIKTYLKGQWPTTEEVVQWRPWSTNPKQLWTMPYTRRATPGYPEELLFTAHSVSNAQAILWLVAETKRRMYINIR